MMVFHKPLISVWLLKMELNKNQRATLKAHIESAPEYSSVIKKRDGGHTIAKDLKRFAEPDFFAYNPELLESTIINDQSVAGLEWDWSLYVSLSASLQSGWAYLFKNGSVDYSKSSVRAAIETIFTGSPGQINHIVSHGTIKVNKLERLFVTKPGSTGTEANPSTMRVTGALSGRDIQQIMGW